MRILLLIISTSFLNICNGQITGKKSNDTYMLFDSIAVNPGDTIFLGNGTDRRGDFVSIFQPENGWIGSEEMSLSRKFANKHFKIKHFKQQKDKKTGEKTVAVVTPGGLNFVADLEQGIELGEIVAINKHDFKKKAAPAAVIVQPVSVADELAKLKKLFDDGVLTKDEYEAAKKKLLNQ